VTVTDGICPQCQRALEGHTFHQWTPGGPWRVYCRPDLTLESPVCDPAVLARYQRVSA